MPVGLVSGLFFLAFAVKRPVWPLHTWLPDAHTDAPTAASVMLAGVLLKMGAYGMLRISATMFPQVIADVAWLLAGAGVVLGEGVHELHESPLADRCTVARQHDAAKRSASCRPLL